jgi:hypothetical protein
VRPGTLVAATFVEEFTRAFGYAMRRAYQDLPDVKAAAQLRWFEHRLEMADKDADAVLEKFKTSLADDPCYAFEWAGSAIEAAAKKHVVARLRAVLRHEAGGLTAAREFALENALRGARSQSHSTSGVSNLANEAKTAAYAEFATIM